MPPRSLKLALQQTLAVFKKNTLLVLALSSALVWVLLFLFSNTFFSESEDILLSTWSSLACSVAFLAGAIALGRVRLRRSRLAHPITPIAASVVVAASTAATVFGALPKATSHVLIAGALVGVGLVLAMAPLIAIAERLVTRELIAIGAVAFAVALGIFALLSWLVGPTGLSYTATLAPLAAGVLFVEYARTLRPRQARPQPASEPPRHVAQPRVLSALVLSSSFLTFYMLQMYPRSTRFANVYYTARIGSTGSSSILLLLFSLILLAALVVLLFTHRDLNRHVLLALAIVVFAGTYLALPSMKNNAFAFVMITPCAALLMFLSLLLLFKDSIPARDADHLTIADVLGPLWASLSAVVASAFAAVFLGPLYNAGLWQDYFFVIVAAVLFVLIVVLTIVLKDEFLRLLLPDYRFRQDLDTSSLENRCRVLAETEGLTARETEILCLLAEGRNAPYIETHLGVSRATVKSHISHIYQKVGVHSHQELLDLLRAAPRRDATSPD